MKEYLKSVKWNMVFISLALIVFGFILALNPETSSAFICNVVGWACIALGSFCVIRYLIQDVHISIHRNDFMIGVVLIVIGIQIMIKKEFFLSLVPMFFGIIVMTSGLSKLQDGIDCARLGYSKGMVYIGLAIISLILGIFIITYTFESAKLLFILAGIALIYCGLSDLASTLVLSNKVRAYEKKNTEEEIEEEIREEEPVQEEAE